MKKIILFTAVLSFAAKTGFSQDASKSVRFGLKVTPAVNWLKPDNEKKIIKDGAVVKMGIGLQAEFKLTEVASIYTGAEYTGAGGKLNYKGSDTAIYFIQDDQVAEPVLTSDGSLDTTFLKTSGLTWNYLNNRKYNVGYLNIPLGIKLKTKDIGGLTYFGTIGANLLFRMKGRSNDDVKQFSMTNATGTETEITKQDIAKQVGLFSAAAGFGAGAEYNLSGSTSMFFALNYQHSFLNFTQADTKYLIREKAGVNGKFEQFPNKTMLRQLVLTVGILF